MTAGTRLQESQALRRRALTRIACAARHHAAFLTLVSFGAVLRALAQMAYRPALIVVGDAPLYLQTAATLEPHRLRPIGYSAFLRLLPIEDNLALVPFVQHLLGVALGIGIYVLLLRLGVRRGIAAVAAAPVLLDVLQLNVEHNVVTEPLFEVLVLGGIALLLWHERPDWRWTAGAGLLFALALLTRSGALLIFAPAVLAVLFLRAGAVATASLVTAFALPVMAYAVWFHSHHGIYGLTDSSGRWLYGRAATFVDCDTLAMPPHERQLCPKEPLGQRLSPDSYVWDRDVSPHYRAVPPPGMTRAQMERDFARRTLRAQPADFLSGVATDFLRGFAPVRSSRPGGPSVERWRFQPQYPLVSFPPRMQEAVDEYGYRGGTADTRLTPVLLAYQRVAVTPGPLLLVALLAGAAAFLARRRLGSIRLPVAAGLFSATAVAYLLPAAVITFSWRYQVLQLVLLPPAAALAWTAWTTRPAPGRREESGPTPKT